MMSKAAETSQAFNVVLLCCQQALGGDVPATGDPRPGPGCVWRLEILPCSSKAKISHLFRILEAGAEAVEWVACPADRCRLLDGGNRAERRAARARALLSEGGLSPEKVGLSRGSALSVQDLNDRAGRRAALAKG